MGVLLFAINCGDVSGTSMNKVGTETKDSVATPTTDIKSSVLTSYNLRGDGEKYSVFRNETELTSFLKSTGYGENDSVIYQTNFEKWTYFAIMETNWRPYTWGNISYDQDTVIVNYNRYIPPECDDSLFPCRRTLPRMHVDIFFIPFTEKPIVFAETIKRFGE
jgi:hypothetical protein